MTPRRTVTLAAAALAVSLLAPAPPAVAHDQAWRTGAMWGMTESGGEAVVGWLTSANEGCLNERRVKVLQVRAGRDRVVGIDRRTGVPIGSGDGYINAPVNLREGKRYYIKALAKNIGSGAHDHLCKAYTAPPVRWSDPTP